MSRDTKSIFEGVLVAFGLWIIIDLLRPTSLKKTESQKLADDWNAMSEDFDAAAETFQKKHHLNSRRTRAHV